MLVSVLRVVLLRVVDCCVCVVIYCLFVGGRCELRVACCLMFVVARLLFGFRDCVVVRCSLFIVG